MTYLTPSAQVFDVSIKAITSISDGTNFFPTLQVEALPDEVLDLLSVRVYNDDAAAAVAYVTHQSAPAVEGSAPTGANLLCAANSTDADSALNKTKVFVRLVTVPSNDSKIVLKTKNFIFKTSGTDSGSDYYIRTDTYDTVAKAAAQFCAKVNAVSATTLVAGVVDAASGRVLVVETAGLATFGTALSSKSGGDSSTSISLVERNRAVQRTVAGGSPTNPTALYATSKHRSILRLASKATLQENFDDHCSAPVRINGRRGESLGVAFGSAVVVDVRLRFRQNPILP